MKKRFVFLSILVAAVLTFAAISINTAPAASAASSKTGVGLSEHVLKAYQQGWKYRSACYGQFVNGVRSTDCSGLIKSYLWWTGETTNPSPGLVSVAGSSGSMLSSASSSGKINYSSSSSLPRIHGLILYQPGHVGVYVGNNMAVDNRTTGVNIKYEKVFGRTSPKWTMWFKLPQITYPTTGFVTFNGNKYYYENGQYVINTTKTVDGTTYTFGSAGTITSSSAAAETTDSKVEAAITPTSAKKSVAVKALSSSKTVPSVQISTVTYAALKVDSTSDAVKQLQQRLKDLGYYYEGVNTYYDYCVVDAVSAYQNAAGLKVTGTADAATLASMYAASAPKNAKNGTLTPGLHSSLVAKMQTRLIELGYMTGETSAFYGDVTKQAVLAYQKAAGISPTGIMDPAALNQLYSGSAVKAAVSSGKVPGTSTVSTPALTSENKVDIYDDMVPTANAATVVKTEEKQNSGGYFALFFVLASGFLTGTFMLLKNIKKRGIKDSNFLMQQVMRVKTFSSNIKTRKEMN